MTTRPRILEAPRIDPQTYAVRATARASHGLTLAELANDAATGHPAQRLSIPRTTGGTFHGWLIPWGDLRLVRVTILAALRAAGTWSAGEGVSVALAITDGSMTVSGPPDIPDDFGSVLLPRVDSPWRIGTVEAHTAWLDYGELVTAGLDPTQVWRVTAVVTCDATVVCEGVLAEEVPRFLTDDADDAGLVPDAYQLRQPIVAGAQSFRRVEETLRAAYLHSLRTYHHGCPGEADPYICTSGSYAPLGQDSDDGTARVWSVRPRKMRGASSTGCRVTLLHRYRITGASPGDKAYLRLTTGAGAYVSSLTNVSGSWVDATPLTAYLTTMGSADTLVFDAKRDAGTFEIAARLVVDNPAL